MTNTTYKREHAYETMQEVFLQNYGVLKAQGRYYLVCCGCGKHVSKRQAVFSMTHMKHTDGKGKVMCIDCQKLYLKERKTYSCPEHVKDEKDMAKIKYTKDCQCCGKNITVAQISVSLEVTSDDNGKNGTRMCKKCLITKYGTHAKSSRVNVRKEIAVTKEPTIIEETPVDTSYDPFKDFNLA